MMHLDDDMKKFVSAIELHHAKRLMPIVTSRQVLPALNVPRSINQVKEPVCREGVPHICRSISFSVLEFSVTVLSLPVVHMRVCPCS